MAQTHPADEIVLVFDGAVTPELEAVVSEFEAKLPLSLVKLPKNLGLGKALNEGLKHCSHDWVFRMDTDDICVPERFAKQVAFIEQHPDTIIFGGQIAEFGENIQDIVAYRHVPTEAQDIVKFTQKRCPFNHMTVAYQKSAVINCGGYEDVYKRQEQDILGANNQLADMNRRFFANQHILALNLVSSPGSGKTTLLTTTLNA